MLIETEDEIFVDVRWTKNKQTNNLAFTVYWYVIKRSSTITDELHTAHY